MADTSSTTTFKADISSLKAEMQAAARAVRVANSEFKAATAGMDDWSDSADGLEAKIKQLQTVLKAQNKQVELAAKELEKTEKEYGKNSAEADRAKIKYNNFKAAAAQTEKALNDYEKELEDVGSATEDVEEATESASDGFTVMKGVLADLVATGIKAGIKGLKKLGEAAVQAYEDFDDGYDNIIKATGATGKSADELRKSYKNVSKSVIGDFSDIGSALGEVSTRFGFTDDELESATEKFIKFADITGTDATTAVRLVSRAMGDAGIDASEYSSLLDDLAKASQVSGISVETLTENLTKYGAPMRALGFDTKASIAIFSQWEKAGVNTEIAFSGMKKAIGNWSKEGKDAREEFGKTLERIAEAPDIAEATEIAIEAFGQKAGPDLADAIQQGRFEYSDFLDLLETSTGTVEDVYDQTQDGWDKVKLAIQGAKADLGDYIGDLLEKYEPQITQFIENFVKKAEELLTWLSENSGTVEKYIKGIGTVIGTAFVVSKVNGFIDALRSLRAAFGVTKTVAETLTENGGLLAKAFANPVTTGVVGGFLALAAATWLVDDAVTNEMKSQYKLSEAQKTVVQKSQSLRDAYNESKEARKKNFATINTEKAYLVGLVEEYNGLIDENGNVKKGYEERANYITGELATALGVEREDIQKNIGENGKLKDSIYDIIAAQRAQAMLSAGKSSYQDALEHQSEALDTYNEAVKVVDETEANYQKTQEDLANAIKQRDAILESGGAVDAEEQAIARLSQVNETAKQSYDEATKGLEAAEEALVGYNSTIENYENLSAAVVTGDMDEIGEAALKLEHDFQTAETGTKESLTKQSANLRSELSDMKKALKNGTPGVTQAMVDGLEGLVKAADRELQKVSVSGKNATDELAQRIQARKAVVKKAGEEVGKEVKKGVEVGLAGFDAPAETATNNFTKAVENKKKKAETAGEVIGKAATNGAETQLVGFGIIGTQYGEEYSKKLDAKAPESKKAGKDVGKAATNGVETMLAGFGAVGTESGKRYAKQLREMAHESQQSGETIGTSARGGTELVLAGFGASGTSAGANYNSGISSQNSAAYSAGSSLASNAKSGTEGTDTYSTGVNFAQGFINGIGSLVQSAANKARELIRSAINAAKAEQQEGSPSKVTYQSGVYFTQGFINGIVSQEKTLVRTVQDMVGTVVKELGKVSAYNFDTVGKNASKIFVDQMSKDINYMTAKMEYQNEQKLAEFDTKISSLETERDKKINALNNSKTVDVLQKELKKEQNALSAVKKRKNESEKAEEKKLKDDYNKAVKKLEAESTQKQRALQKQINTTKDKDAKERLRDELTAEKDALKAKKENAKTLLNKNLEAVSKNFEREFAVYEKQSKAKQKQLEKQITAEEKANEKQIKAVEKEYDKLIATQREYQESYQMASSQMIQDFRQAMDDYSSAAQAMIDDVINGIVDRYSDRYDELVDKQNDLIDKLKGTGDLFKVSGAGVMTVNDLQEQTKQIQTYTSKLQQIKNKVSSELFDQIASYDMKEGAAFMDRLLAMSAKDLDAYNKAYTDKLQAAQKAGESIYKSDFDRVAKDYTAEINTAFKSLPAQLEQLGIQTMKGFVTGLTSDTDYMVENIRTYVAAMVDTFKQQLGIRSPSKVMYEIGEYTGEGLNDGLMSMLGYVQHTASEFASLLSQPLDLMDNLNDVRSAVSQAGYASPVGGVINNYNLVQNNNSPKALSALETYQARRRQIAMIQAFA